MDTKNKKRTEILKILKNSNKRLDEIIEIVKELNNKRKKKRQIH